MAESPASVKKSTLYLAIGISLIVGFLSGVVYSVYNAPPAQQQAAVAPQSQQDSQAITALELETQTHPENVQAWVRLGHAYFDSDQPAKAIEAYTRALDLMPGDTNVMTDMGVMYRRVGKPEKAIETFDAVLALNPRHEQARFNKGVVLLNDFKDQDSALAEWRKLLEINPMAKAPSGAPLGEIIDQIASAREGQ